MTVTRHAVRNLQLHDETTQSLEASWELEDPHVESYRVSYTGLSGDHKDESVSSSSHSEYMSPSLESSATFGIVAQTHQEIAFLG